eukprot:gnl/TRDRNA2_/TRDRNA2_127408_c0_seq1.p2 gnl/TRDRNA2_/TRDRNA2_127408_c0~~gnl/TRDRNA2_/TRDRNA2_127408_c0_seq1.p2  ORF type:complete len:103 (+),score=4.03 gnl/TRDRNA2_/TRDRNA2_127408_c0_seq1:316-624(+)
MSVTCPLVLWDVCMLGRQCDSRLELTHLSVHIQRGGCVEAPKSQEHGRSGGCVPDVSVKMVFRLALHGQVDQNHMEQRPGEISERGLMSVGRGGHILPTKCP